MYDLSDPTAPDHVATAYAGSTFALPTGMALDESRGLLYVAWGTPGVIVYDVTGDLFGDLVLGGREITGTDYGGSGAGCAGRDVFAGAVGLGSGEIYVVDENSGLVTLQPGF